MARQLFALAVVILVGVSAGEGRLGPTRAWASGPTSALPAGAKTTAARGEIRFIAADQGRLAMIVQGGLVQGGPAPAQSVAVWDAARGSVVRFGSASRDTTGHAFNAFSWDVALGADSVAWVEQVCLCAHETPMLVELARLDRPSSKPSIVAFTSSPDGGTGDFLGDLHSGDSVIAFDNYHVCDQECPSPYKPLETSRTQDWLVGAGQQGACASIDSGAGEGSTIFVPESSVRCARLRAADGTSEVVAVGSGRIALAGADGSVDLVDTGGHKVVTVPSNPTNTIKAVVLDATQLDLLVRAPGGGAVLEAHDPTTGALEQSVMLTNTHTSLGPDPCEDACLNSSPSEFPPLRLEGTRKGIVAYVAKRTLHLLRLADRRDVVVATSLHSDGLHAQFDDSGLFYTYDVGDRKHPGRVVHLPWSAVTALVDSGTTCAEQCVS